MKRQNIKYAKVAHVRAADSTDKKIKGLTVQVRYCALFFCIQYSIFLYGSDYRFYYF